MNYKKIDIELSRELRPMTFNHFLAKVKSYLCAKNQKCKSNNSTKKA